MGTVKDLPKEERPRERLLAHGAEHISAVELLAVVIGRGVAGHSVLTLAQELLERFGSLAGVVEASPQDLQQVTGLGEAKALQLKACLEIARRVSAEDRDKEIAQQTEKAIASPLMIAEEVRAKIRDFTKEQFFVLSFDNRNRIGGIDLVAVGTLNANLVHPRETFDRAIARHAACIAISHNHPSGDPTPSEADKVLTQRLAQAGELMGIHLLDHVIVTKTNFFSFRTQKLL